MRKSAKYSTHKTDIECIELNLKNQKIVFNNLLTTQCQWCLKLHLVNLVNEYILLVFIFYQIVSRDFIPRPCDCDRGVRQSVLINQSLGEYFYLL